MDLNRSGQIRIDLLRNFFDLVFNTFYALKIHYLLYAAYSSLKPCLIPKLSDSKFRRIWLPEDICVEGTVSLQNSPSRGDVLDQPS